jgi:hypothetical protein
MWGIGGKGKHTVDPTKLPLLLYTIQSVDAFALVQKVWDTNVRITRIDVSNKKEVQHFVFSNPDCVVWLQRDQGRTDCFELILMWDGEEEDVTEIYIIGPPVNGPVGDDVRVKSLLGTMLSAPSTVPVQGDQTTRQASQ